MTAALQDILRQLDPAQRKRVEDFARSLAEGRPPAPDRFLNPDKWCLKPEEVPPELRGKSGVELQHEVSDWRAQNVAGGSDDVPD